MTSDDLKRPTLNFQKWISTLRSEKDKETLELERLTNGMEIRLALAKSDLAPLRPPSLLHREFQSNPLPPPQSRPFRNCRLVFPNGFKGANKELELFGELFKQKNKIKNQEDLFVRLDLEAGVQRRGFVWLTKDGIESFDGNRLLMLKSPKR